MADKQILTKDSLVKLQAELEELKVVKRKEIAQKIKEAREQGDLSENAEYDAAKEEQRDIEGRIEELEALISSAEVIDTTAIDFNKIHVGCSVTVTDKKTKLDRTFQIVDKSEVNSRLGKISYDSPIGKALMNQEVGKSVDVETPGGLMKLKIKNIERAVV